jgi:hypothetical protein
MLNTKHFLMFLFGLFVCVTSLVIAQDEPKDQLYWVREEVVKVEKWQQYEETSKQWIEMMTGAGLDFPYMRASQRDDGHYYYLLPLSSYSDIDMFPEKFGSAIEKIGKEKWGEFSKRNESSMDYHKDFIVKWNAEYSYIPKEPRIKSNEVDFLHWIFFTFKLENKKEVLDVLAEWKELYEKNNIPDGWSTWTIEVGEQNNMVAISESAKDGASFYAAMDENSAKIKEEEQKLWQKLSEYVTGIEQKFGKPRPDLGFENTKEE